MVAHSHKNIQTGNNLIFAILINVIVVIIEIIFGMITRSMALISDALHNCSDIGAMVLSLWGEKVAHWPVTDKKTYGYKRIEALVAFVNGGVLLGFVVFVLLEATIRLFNPQPVEGLVIMAVAGFALVGNGIATLLLQQNAHKNLNLKSAWLHSFQDALFSLGVIASAGVIYLTGWIWLDPLVSIGISLLLLKSVLVILKDAVNMLLDSVPKGLDFTKIKNELLNMPGVASVDDLHIWQTGSENRMLSAHLVVSELTLKQRLELITDAEATLKKSFLISHITFQIISVKELESLGLTHGHCN
jgi:cobalt-zinc-cadmium efflux system protein